MEQKSKQKMGPYSRGYSLRSFNSHTFSFSSFTGLFLLSLKKFSFLMIIWMDIVKTVPFVLNMTNVFFSFSVKESWLRMIERSTHSTLTIRMEVETRSLDGPTWDFMILHIHVACLHQFYEALNWVNNISLKYNEREHSFLETNLNKE